MHLKIHNPTKLGLLLGILYLCQNRITIDESVNRLSSSMWQEGLFFVGWGGGGGWGDRGGGVRYGVDIPCNTTILENRLRFPTFQFNPCVPN